MAVRLPETVPMPITNDNESKKEEVLLESSPDDSSSPVREEVLEASILDLGTNGIPKTPPECQVCHKGLLPIGYRGWYGWSHPETPCDPSEEQWAAWSLRWAAKIDRVPSGRVGARLGGGILGPSCEIDAGDSTRTNVLLRSKSPRTMESVRHIEDIEKSYGNRVVWIWEAASKSIFLNSDGFLRVYGKGAVLSSARCPVLLDFGAGFITRDSFERRVAHILDTKLMDDNLLIKFRWLSHEQAVGEIYSCSPNLFSSKVNSRE